MEKINLGFSQVTYDLENDLEFSQVTDDLEKITLGFSQVTDDLEKDLEFSQVTDDLKKNNFGVFTSNWRLGKWLGNIKWLLTKSVEKREIPIV